MSHFAKYCKQNHSTAFDFLVIFCSFCVYSLVPGVWHLFLGSGTFFNSPSHLSRPLVPRVWHLFSIHILFKCRLYFFAGVWHVMLQNRSTAFDIFVIFCSFYVYSLVPGVWHPVFLLGTALFCLIQTLIRQHSTF